MKQKYIMQTQFDFAGDFFAQNHSTFRQGMPLRLWERFDFDSTFKPVRLWRAGCRLAHHVRSVFRPGGYASQNGPSWAKCAFWVNISLNHYLANIKLTLHRALNFGSSPKAQKCIKKRRRGCRKRWKTGGLFCFVALHALLAGPQNVTVYTLPGGGCCNLQPLGIFWPCAYCNGFLRGQIPRVPRSFCIR